MLVLSVFVFTFLWDIDGWRLVWPGRLSMAALVTVRARHEASQARGPARDAFIQIFPPPFRILRHSSHCVGPLINLISSINRCEFCFKVSIVIRL